MKKIKKTIVPIEISARHIHLSQKDLDKLFGKGYKLHILRKLSQKGEFAAKETVNIVTLLHCYPEKIRTRLRVGGPARKESQIEISRTDAINLEINAALRLSGDLKGVKTYLEVKGPKGNARVKVIVAKRHLHCSLFDAKKLKLKNNQKVRVQVTGERGLIFENVIVRVGENYNLACHIDTDEANACSFSLSRPRVRGGRTPMNFGCLVY